MFTTRPEIAGTFGAVATTHWAASAVGMAVLERGGNAFDAAVAAGFTLQIFEPHLNGPAGDCPILLHSAKLDRQFVICGQGPAPAGLTIDLLRDDLGLDLVPGTGMLAAAIPGAFDAWMRLLRDHGTWRVADVLEFAISYARDGAHMVPRVAAAVQNVRPLFEQEWPTSAALWLKDGGPAPGALFANPTLAYTYTSIVAVAAAAGGDREAQIEAARTAWSRGFVADAIDRFVRATEALDTSGRRHRGVLTAHDMAGWQAGEEAPLSQDYRGHTVLKCGPWSQGPAMLQSLAILEGLDIAAMDPVGADLIHAVIEAQKLAFADREAFYGDPDFADVPMAALLSTGYAAERRALIGQRASLEWRPGSPGGRAPHSPDYAAAVARSTMAAAGSGEPTVARMGAVGGDTCHIDVIDRWGNFCSATPSGGWLHSSPAIPELGFCLGTRCQMFWIDPTHPNGLAPGKRPRTTLSPSLVLREGRPWLSFGTPGGEQQDQWQAIMLLRMIDHRLTVQQAIDLPSFHGEHWISSFWPRGAKPGRVVLEGRYAPEVATAVRERGHRVEVGGDWSEGRLSGARLEPDGQIFAGANPRGMQGYAVGR